MIIYLFLKIYLIFQFLIIKFNGDHNEINVFDTDEYISPAFSMKYRRKKHAPP
jgi:hypothetical protein